jgi:hypothetical protein
MSRVFWDEGDSLVFEYGPVRKVIAHVMDGEVHIYDWHDPAGDDAYVHLPFKSPDHGRKLLAAIFAEYGEAIPDYQPLDQPPGAKEER